LELSTGLREKKSVERGEENQRGQNPSLSRKKRGEINVSVSKGTLRQHSAGDRKNSKFGGRKKERTGRETI